LFYTGGGVVDSLSYTILGSATKRLKESDLVVTQSSNNFGRLYNLEIQIQQFENPKTTKLKENVPLSSVLPS